MKIARKFAVAGGVTALVLGAGLGGVALADIPDSDDGEFHACVSNGGGQVRLIDKEGGASCHSYETEKTWGGTVPTLETRMVTRQYTGNVSDEIPCPTGYTATGMGWVTNSDTLYWGNNRPYNAGSGGADLVTHWQVQSENVLSGETVKVMITCVGYAS